jgi:hypothetical protein
VTTVIRFEYMEMQALWKYSGERIWGVFLSILITNLIYEL